MHLKRITLAGFGRLRGAFSFEPNRCNILCQDNEFGKTTLVDSILYSLYDFPSTGLKRGELKPREKYRPWSGTGDYRVEIEMAGLAGRNLRLRNDFGRSRGPEVTDLDTGEEIRLGGQAFGEMFFRMPLESFAGCFFLRQDEREGSGRRELVEVVEQAAVSNRRSQDAPVRRAMESLADCRLHLEEFSQGPIGIERLISRIDEQLDIARSRIAAVAQARERNAADIAAAETADREIARLSDEMERLDCETATAELLELNDLLARHNRAESLLQGRLARLRELEPHASSSSADLDRAVQLFSDWRSQAQLADDARRQLEQGHYEEMQVLEEATEALPEGLRAVTRDQVDRLRSLIARLSEAETEIKDQAAMTARQSAELVESGVPVEEYATLSAGLDAMPDSDRRRLLEAEGHHADLEHAIADSERRVAEAGAEAERARRSRDQKRSLATILFIGLALAISGGVALLLMGGQWPVVAGSLLLVAGCALGAGGFFQLHRSQQMVALQLEPALAAEITASAEATKAREKLDALEAETGEIMQRHSLDPAFARRLRDLGPWGRQVSAYQAQVDVLERLRRNLGEVKQTAAVLASRAIPGITPAEVTAERLAEALARMESVVETTDRRGTLAEQVARKKSEVAELERRRDESRAAFEAIIGTPPEGRSIDDHFETYRESCRLGEEYRRLSAETDAGALMSPDDLARTRQRAESCTARISELVENNPTLEGITPSAPRAQLQDRLAEVRNQLHEMRLQRVNAFHQCDAAVEQWRRDTPRCAEEIERLESLRGEMVRFRDATAIAREELGVIAERVFSQWATELNKRANEVLAALGPRYSDLQVTANLEVSVYAEESARRLSPKEIAHLSKGARDQLSLALRIAVSEYLSEHAGRLPLVFDEPFAHWDDGRFVEGMRLLARLAERHQVIVVSCHKWRYDQLRTADPALAAELRFCDFKPLQGQ